MDDLKLARRIKIGLAVLGFCLAALWLFLVIRGRDEQIIISWFLLLCSFGISDIIKIEKQFLKNGVWPASKSQRISIRICVFYLYLLASILSAYSASAYYFIAGIGCLRALQLLRERCEKDNLSVYELAKKYFNAARERLGRLIQHGFKS